MWLCIWPKDCVIKAYSLSKCKANQSGLATYAGNTVTHRPCSYIQCNISLGHQEILGNSMFDTKNMYNGG